MSLFDDLRRFCLAAPVAGVPEPDAAPREQRNNLNTDQPRFTPGLFVALTSRHTRRDHPAPVHQLNVVPPASYGDAELWQVGHRLGVLGHRSQASMPTGTHLANCRKLSIRSLGTRPSSETVSIWPKPRLISRHISLPNFACLPKLTFLPQTQPTHLHP